MIIRSLYILIVVLVVQISGYSQVETYYALKNQEVVKTDFKEIKRELLFKAESTDTKETFGLALGAPMAYYTASGQLGSVAAALWLVNALYFGGTVFYIKLKVRQQPRLAAPDRVSERLVKAKACLAYQTIALTIIAALVAFQWAPWLALLAFVPVTIKVIHGAWQWQDKKSLSITRLGVTEIVHAVAFSLLVIIAFI